MKAVVFDVGETLVDETRAWGALADAVGVPRLTFFGALGAVIERGLHHREVFALLGVEWVDAWPPLERGDLYADAKPCLEELRRSGYEIGLAANQPERTARFADEAGLEVDFVATSAGWGVEKPAPEFFTRIVETVGRPAGEIAYVGDRLDNDVLPAKRAGMAAVFLRRGPWGVVHATRPRACAADVRLESLAALPGALQAV